MTTHLRVLTRRYVRKNETFTVTPPERGPDPAKFRSEDIGGNVYQVAYVNGKRYILRLLGAVGDCIRP